MAILFILRPLGIFNGHLVYPSRFGTVLQEKSGNSARLGTHVHMYKKAAKVRRNQILLPELQVRKLSNERFDFFSF
jgi:hypothetical protein